VDSSKTAVGNPTGFGYRVVGEPLNNDITQRATPMKSTRIVLSGGPFDGKIAEGQGLTPIPNDVGFGSTGEGILIGVGGMKGGLPTDWHVVDPVILEECKAEPSRWTAHYRRTHKETPEGYPVFEYYHRDLPQMQS
jgi:hypothetical protein